MTINSGFVMDKQEEERDVTLAIPAGGSNSKRFVA